MDSEGTYRVVFLNDRNQEVVKWFTSYYQCQKFVNKCKHSKRVRLVAYPSFYD